MERLAPAKGKTQKPVFATRCINKVMDRIVETREYGGPLFNFAEYQCNGPEDGCCLTSRCAYHADGATPA